MLKNLSAGCDIPFNERGEIPFLFCLVIFCNTALIMRHIISRELCLRDCHHYF